MQANRLLSELPFDLPLPWLHPTSFVRQTGLEEVRCLYEVFCLRCNIYQSYRSIHWRTEEARQRALTRLHFQLRLSRQRWSVLWQWRREQCRIWMQWKLLRRQIQRHRSWNRSWTFHGRGRVNQREPIFQRERVRLCEVPGHMLTTSLRPAGFEVGYYLQPGYWCL